MKKGLSILALASFLFLGNADAQAQAGLKKSNKEYDSWAYVDAMNIYEKIVNKGYVSQDILEKLGNTYYFNARYAQAQPFYERLFTEFATEEIASEFYYRYAQTLQHTGRTAEAKTYYDLFIAKIGSQTQIATVRKNEADLKKQIKTNSGRYSSVENLPINTQFADFGSHVHNNQLYFTSARDTGSFSKKIHTWTGEAFTSLYQYNLPNDTVSKKLKVKKLKGDVKSKFNESTTVLTADGKTMYFTRNNMLGNTRGYDVDKNTKLKIYRAELQNGKWNNIQELPFNSNDFSTAHPTLNKDGSILYFASDRPGGYGNSDLWMVTVNGNGYGVPQNLGPTINTEGRETFPFINSNDELYFSSDGRIGLGGLDVYGVKIKEDGSFYEVQNIGEPINSNTDDFAYFIDYQTKKGFFSSNRLGGQGNDDIYSFIETKALNLGCSQELVITVVDSKTRNIIPEASLNLYDNLYNELASSDKFTNGGFRFNTDYKCGETYRVKVSKEGYITKEDVAVLDNESGISERTIVLEQIKVEVKKNDDLFKVLKLKPIYFDYDKDNIRPDAALELAKVVEVLKDYPRMKIDVRSHTDSRGSDQYNLKLSERRAKSTAQWIADQGIDISRITYKGYGETQLLNKCINGSKCSDTEHEENRRSEFIVLEL